MNTMKRSFDVTVIFLLALTIALFAGCSGEPEAPQTVEQANVEVSGDKTVGKELLTLRDTLEYSINVAMERLRLGDKSGLYENEFEYYFEEATYDDYLKLYKIIGAEADSLTHVDVTDVTLYDHDSADISVVVRFEGKSGVPSRLDDRITMYYHKGRWIRPTVSCIAGQVEYEKKGGK